MLVNVHLRHGCQAGQAVGSGNPTGKGGHSECILDAPYSARRLVAPGNVLGGQCVCGHGTSIRAPVSPKDI